MASMSVGVKIAVSGKYAATQVIRLWFCSCSTIAVASRLVRGQRE
jgi:hypothetical protein